MNDLLLLGRETAPDLQLPGTRSTALPIHALHARRERLRTVLLLLLDAGMVFAGFTLAYMLRYVVQFGRAVKYWKQLTDFGSTITLLVVATLLVLALKGLYRLPRNAGWLSQISIILSSVTTAIALTIIVTFITKAEYYSRLIFAFAWIAMIITLGLGRFVVNSRRHRRWAVGHDLERVLVVGGMGLAHQVMDNLQDRPSLGYELVGFVADQTHPVAAEPPVPETLNRGHIPELPMVIAREHVDRVIVALPFWENHQLPVVVEACHKLGVPFQVVPDFYELSFDRVTIQELRGMPLIDLRENMIQGWNYALKRVLDIGLVLLTGPFWLALSLVIMIVIRLDSPGPVIFSQTRIGRKQRPFKFLKFRTMVANAEELKESLLEQNEGSGPMFKIKRDPRMTRIGRFLRRTSLDEIPQLWNVLMGEMSLVGPRPSVPEEVAQYESWQLRRLEVTPGVTGLWQATGRSNTTFEEMVRLDIYYAEHWSVGMDIRILLLTIPAILAARGAY
ncbi:MAG: sugar transferase [Herpetosiphonaceae bacterium]|nr:sugar transferase [Herpetosiphonaceae bacterium]